MKYRAVFAMRELGVFDDLKSAFKAIHDAVKAEKTLMAMVLDGATWVEVIGGPPGPRVRSFYEVRDHAVDMGWLRDGRWVERQAGPIP